MVKVYRLELWEESSGIRGSYTGTSELEDDSETVANIRRNGGFMILALEDRLVYLAEDEFILKIFHQGLWTMNGINEVGWATFLSDSLQIQSEKSTLL